MFTLINNKKLISLDKPLVMGILNTNNDSFYAQSRVNNEAELHAYVEKMVNAGVDIIDIGGQSTRPGSTRIGAEDELEAVLFSIQFIKQNYPKVQVSVDTYHAEVAQKAVLAGAGLVNDISGGQYDGSMWQTVAELQVPYILMHTNEAISDMHVPKTTGSILPPMIDFFVDKIERLRKMGVHDVVVDPGIGFGKTLAQNIEIIKNLSVFKMLGCPILVGLSRKSFIYKSLGKTADDVLTTSSALHFQCLLNGANILRVHDVAEAKELVDFCQIYK